MIKKNITYHLSDYLLQQRCRDYVWTMYMSYLLIFADNNIVPPAHPFLTLQGVMATIQNQLCKIHQGILNQVSQRVLQEVNNLTVVLISACYCYPLVYFQEHYFKIL